MSNKDLPLSWVKCELGDLGDIIAGGTPSTTDPDNFSGDIAWLTPADLSKYNEKYIAHGKRNITEKGLKSSSAKLMPAGSILFSSRAPIGYTVISSNLISTNQGFKSLVPSKLIFNEYIYYYLKANKNLAEKHASGTTFKEISGSNFGKLPIPLPPLNEQKRIVWKIENLFSGIDSGVEKLERAKTELKQYKQSVLKSAFEGKLYKTTEWKEVRLGDVAEVNPRTDIPIINDDEDVSFLPMPAVKAEINFYLEEKAKFNKVKKGYTKFQDNDVLFAKITPCMENGKSCVVKNLKNGVGFGSTEFHVVRCSKNLLPEFIFSFLVQENFRKTAKSFMSGAVGQQRVPKDYLKNIKFKLPTISEQQKIIKEIEKHMRVAEELEKTVIESLESAKKLKQSILKKAFEGKLVPQHPNEEPASVLLEKIKAEKETNQPKRNNKPKGKKKQWTKIT